MASLNPTSALSLLALALALPLAPAAAAVPATPTAALALQRGRAGAQQPRSAGTVAPRTARRSPRSAPGEDDGLRASSGRPELSRGRGSSSDGERELGNPFGYPPEQQQKIWFSTADDDRTDWISFREARGSMRFDAPRFRVFDTDNDGRMTFEEFQAFVLSEATEGRSILEPRAMPSSKKPPRRNAEQLRAAYDADLDGAISRMEFERIIREYGRREELARSAQLMSGLDVDGTGVLELDELGRVVSFVMPRVADPNGIFEAQPGARTVLELFGKRIDNGDAHPPTITGPVRPFRRLDLDEDGFVSIEDLERLEGRTSTTVRLGSVLNTLDIDYDGRLSVTEFLGSMTPKRSLRSDED